MNKSYKNFPEIMKDIFRKIGYTGHYIHRSLTTTLDKTRNVVITLVTSGTHEHWTGFSVAIMHKQNGTIVQQFFPFQDYLQSTQDNGQKYSPYVWRSSALNQDQLHWFGFAPTEDSIFEMTDAIDNYLSDWK